MAKELLLDFTDAEEVRNELTEDQQKEIENLFVGLSKEVQKQAEKAPRVPSDALCQQYLKDLQKQVDKAVDGFRKDIQGIVEGNMEKAASSVVDCNFDFLKAIGMPIEGAFSHVPVDTVVSVATGKLYDSNWTLSRQLWKQSVHIQKDVNTVIATGIAANKSAYDIAKDLEKYVDPKARKEWDWSKVYPGTAKKVDYNAQRLARTMVSHAYQQAFVRTTQKNPFVTEYEWQSSNSERTCEICEERDGQHYPKDDLPLDHPNGMCTFIAVIPDDMEAIAERLGDWANGKDDPELDKWAEDLYGGNWDKSNQKDTYSYMTKAEYTSWQAQNSTSSKVFQSVEDEFGIKLGPNHTLAYKDDVYIEEGPYKGMWLSEVVDQRSNALSIVTRSYGCGYVQNADGSRAINTYWRTGSAQGLLYRKSEILETSKALDTLIQTSTIDQQVCVDRWAGAKSLERMGIQVTGSERRIGHAFVTDMDPYNIAQQIQEQLVGVIVEDKAYMSASMQSDLNVFRGSDVKYSIQVPKGTHAYITDNTAESEVVFARGTKQEILGARVVQEEAYDYEGKPTQREVVEITVRILS